MKRTFILMCTAVMSWAGCTHASGNADWPWQDMESEPEQREETWTDISDAYPSLPDYIRIMKSPETLLEKKAVAYAAIADMSRAALDIWCINDPKLEGCDEGFRTPSEIYSETPCPVIVNGGFFYADWSVPKYYSMSLAVRDGQILSQNINYTSEDWKTIYYPTRAAFLVGKDGKASSCWTYYSSSLDKTYVYQSPAKNSWNKKPLKTPDKSFPEKASEMDAVWGIGGGPVLLKNGKIINSYDEELFLSDVGCTSSNPRTAIGVTSDGHIVLFVCEGREMTEGVIGYTSREVAVIMKNLGCADAINLDGGGSSCMLVEGRETIKVSDGKQRSVACTIMIR